MKELRKPQIRFAGFTDDWEQRKLGEIAEKIERKAPENSNAPVMMISASSGFINQSEKYSTNNAGSSLSKYTLLKAGELSYNHGYSKLRNFGSCFDLKVPEARIPFVYHSFSLPKDDPQFFATYLNSGIFDKELKKLVSSSARMDGLLNISYEQYMSLDILRPSLPEQTAIGNFFKQLDETIALHQREYEKYQNLKISYLEKMFPKENEQFPELRFPEFTDAWEQRKLGEIFDQTFNFTNPEKDNFELYSLTVEDGLTPKTDRYKRDFLVIKQDQFKLVEPYGFVYNPMNITLGAIDYNKLSNSVAVSGYYTTMSVKYGFDHNFLNIFLSSNTAIEIYRSQATGTLKEKQRVQFPTFSTLSIFVPSFEEQTAIGNFFKQLDETIALHQRELEKYKKIKQSYLEKMFI